MNDSPSDKEKNRLSARALRYGKVGANVGGVAARIAGRRLFGLDARDPTFWQGGLSVIERMIGELEALDARK